MGISIGLVGLGSFGSAFAPLFKNHPAVDRVGFCDREPDLVRRYAEDRFYADKFHPRDCYGSLEEICRGDFDALAVITQPWLHAPQCLLALESGKHVYSAVPVISVPDDDEILEWCDRLVEAVRRTGREYMLGETSFYRPQAMFCRRQAAAGAFGDFVYAEGEYFHDLDSRSNLRRVQQRREASASGREWPPVRERYLARGCRSGPMHYPTHSVCGPVCVMRTRAVSVVAHGWRHRAGDPYFADAAFSNETALFLMENGATVRICEMRETPGKPGADGETFRVFGTRGSFSENNWYQAARPDFEHLDLDHLAENSQRVLDDAEMFDPLPAEVELAFKRVMHRDLDEGALLDIEFKPGGHGGSHPYLVHEFVDAVASGRRPAVNAWEAARYMAMGVAAHRSALREGERVSVPDWGDPPA